MSDAPDVAVEEVGAVHALPAELGVEQEASRLEPAAAEDLVDRQAHLVDRVGELVGVPAVLRVAAVGIDRAEDPVVEGIGDLVVERVARQGGVVDLDVDPELVEQVVTVQEAVDGRAVVVVLVLGRLLRLGLEQQCPGEADRVLVLGDHGEEAGQLVGLLFHAGVEEGLVPFTAAPQHVVVAAQPMRGVDHVPHLRGGVGEHLGIGVGGRAGRVPRVGEQVGRPPQQLDAGLGHLLAGPVDHGIEVRSGLLEAVAFGRHVDVVEREELHAELGDELEGCVLLGPAPPPSGLCRARATDDRRSRRRRCRPPAS